MKIWALTTCFNRRVITLRCLKSLYAAADKAQCQLSVCLVDDGSTDGTTDAVQNEYPEITVLRGDGSLFWAGGMRFGWNEFVKHQFVDQLLVFNDDICFFDQALLQLIQTTKDLRNAGITCTAIAGAFRDPVTGTTTYGAVKRIHLWKSFKFERLDPKDKVVAADTLNMNLALISKEALQKIGFLSPHYVHSKADFDFGFRLKAAGGKVLLAPGHMGECRRNSKSGRSTEAGLSIRQRAKRLFSIKEHPFIETFYYYRKYAGPLWAVLLAKKYFNRLFR